MPATYEPIATTTLGSTSATITFSSIPATYTDLRLVIVPLGTATANLFFTYNNDTGTNYSQTTLSGNGTTAASASATSRGNLYLTYVTNIQTATPTLRTIDIFSYAGSTFKTALTTENSDLNGSGSVARTVGLWSSTSAINRLDIFVSGTTMAAGTTATLYGIKNA